MPPLDLAFAKEFDGTAASLSKEMYRHITIRHMEIIASGLAPAVCEADLNELEGEIGHQFLDVQYSTVPALKGYNTMSNDKVRQQIRMQIDKLESRFRPVKDRILSLLPLLGSRGKGDELESRIHETFGYADDLELLRRYVNKLSSTKTAVVNSVLRRRIWTSFMSAKFDRAVSRLHLRLDDHFTNFGSIQSPARRGGGKRKYQGLNETRKQIGADQEIIRPLILKALDLKERIERHGRELEATEVAKLEAFSSHDSLLGFLTTAIYANWFYDTRALVETLGQDFLEEVVRAAHDLVKADTPKLREYNSTLEKKLGPSPDETDSQTSTDQPTDG
ncbi:hypothetical protein ACHAPT_004014 [Fusarium lateritium]